MTNGNQDLSEAIHLSRPKGHNEWSMNCKGLSLRVWTYYRFSTQTTDAPRSNPSFYPVENISCPQSRHEGLFCLLYATSLGKTQDVEQNIRKATLVKILRTLLEWSGKSHSLIKSSPLKLNTLPLLEASVEGVGVLGEWRLYKHKTFACLAVAVMAGGSRRLPTSPLAAPCSLLSSAFPRSKGHTAHVCRGLGLGTKALVLPLAGQALFLENVNSPPPVVVTTIYLTSRYDTVKSPPPQGGRVSLLWYPSEPSCYLFPASSLTKEGSRALSVSYRLTQA